MLTKRLPVKIKTFYVESNVVDLGFVRENDFWNRLYPPSPDLLSFFKYNIHHCSKKDLELIFNDQLITPLSNSYLILNFVGSN